MLDWYYLNERALPADPKKVARLIRMPQSLDTIGVVLDEFFVLADDGWHNKRADAELDAMLSKQAQQATKGAHEADRMRRHRDRRAELFAALRAVGVVPAWDVPMKDLQRLVAAHCNAPATQQDEEPETFFAEPETHLQRTCNAPETHLQREQAVSCNAPATAIPTPTPTPTPITSKEVMLSLSPRDDKKSNENFGSGELGSTYGRICLAMKAAGLSDTSPGNPEFRVLVDAGADVSEFLCAAQEAAARGKGFRYAIACVAEARKRAADLEGQVHRGKAPPSAQRRPPPEHRHAAAHATIFEGIFE